MAKKKLNAKKSKKLKKAKAKIGRKKSSKAQAQSFPS